MQLELKQLEHKLEQSLITEDDEWRINVLDEKYESIFAEIMKHYLLDDIKSIKQAIRQAVRKTQIREYFLQKELIAEVDIILKQAAN